MKSKTIKFEKEIIEEREGNKILAYYMGDYSTNIFVRNSYYYDSYAFAESWDALMQVVCKIKQQVFTEGYPLFSYEHKLYIRIGNACYDCDLRATWIACIRWCLFYFEKRNMSAIVDYEPEIVISKKAYKQFQSKIMHMPEAEIHKIICSDNLILAHKKRGDGTYTVHGFDDVECVIINKVVERLILEDEEDGEDATVFIRNFRLNKS